MSDSALRTTVHQAPLFRGFSRQEYWSGLPCAPPGDLPDPGIELKPLTSPALAGRFFTTSATWEASRLDTTNLLLEVKQWLLSLVVYEKTHGVLEVL